MAIKIDFFTTMDLKGLKKGEKALTTFQRQALSVGKSLGIAFSAVAITRFAKQSVKAFMADDKALKSLNQTLKNTENAFATAQVTDFIDRTEKLTGVLDDNLRPAFQSLLTATGSVLTAEKELNLALDISAGTGRDVQSVSLALAKSYSGQTASLSKLGAGLSKTLLASGDMVAINAELARLFKGQASVAAESFAGQMDKLNAATQRAKENIGGGLIDAAKSLAGSNGIDPFVQGMDSASKDLADMIRGFGILAQKINAIPLLKGISFKDIIGMIPILGTYANFAIGVGSQSRQQSFNTPRDVANAKSTMSLLNVKERKAETDLIKKANAQRALENATNAAKLKAAADQATIDALKKKLDVERIGIEYALTQTTDATTRAVLQGKLAIMDEDAKAAKAASLALDAAQAATLKQLDALALAAENIQKNFGSVALSADAASAALDKIAAFVMPTTAERLAILGQTPYIPPTATQRLDIFGQNPKYKEYTPPVDYAAMFPSAAFDETVGSYGYDPTGGGGVNVTVQGGIIDTAGLMQYINEGIQYNTRLGLSSSGSASRAA
ncbi:hypothetical protein UFOVP1502_23 [uncultured Caudovirales phage]|uniref:Uncharacterized protein n=1 Tax=uncultured Caudovirales phage TaxID=2100421 RepID=A0A6J5SQ19_9CAUD|nr:hypothetical protein UFOVP1502_23 [uncultured Caudovirales phage]